MLARFFAHRFGALLAVLALTGSVARAQQPGTLPPHWLSQNPPCADIPDWQVHAYNSDLFLLRQSPCSSYEKPFIFLLFGRDRALLLDTGAPGGLLLPALRRTVGIWLAEKNRTWIPLVVVHTHSHSDHTAGDAELNASKDPAMPVTLIPAELAATKRFYGVTSWPNEIGQVDLGGRVLDMIPIPGHDAVSIALYDRQTGILFSGDSLYPGRLYIRDFAAFQASTERLLQFTAGKRVAQILGNHIEQTATPFTDYPTGTIFQPDEHELALSRGSLLELDDALVSLHNAPRRLALRDFTIWPVGPGSENAEETARTRAYIEDQRRKMWAAR